MRFSLNTLLKEMLTRSYGTFSFGLLRRLLRIPVFVVNKGKVTLTRPTFNSRRLPLQAMDVQVQTLRANAYICRQLVSLESYAKRGEWAKYFKLADFLARKSVTFRTLAILRTHPDWYLKHSARTWKRWIRESFNYGNFAPPRRVWIPAPGKPEGRPLSVPSHGQRLFDNLVEMLYGPVWALNISKTQFGKRGIHLCWDLIKRLIPRSASIYTFDYSKFYDKIKGEELLNHLQSPRLKVSFPPSGLFSWYAKQLITADFLDAPTLEGKGTSGLKKRSGLPQGSPLSPILSLLTLEIAGVYNLPNATYVGYIDDGLIFTNVDPARILPSFKNSLQWPSLGIELKPSACNWVKVDGIWRDSLKFLGLNYHPHETLGRPCFSVEPRTGPLNKWLPWNYSLEDYARQYPLKPGSRTPLTPRELVAKSLKKYNAPLLRFLENPKSRKLLEPWGDLGVLKTYDSPLFYQNYAFYPYTFRDKNRPFITYLYERQLQVLSSFIYEDLLTALL